MFVPNFSFLWKLSKVNSHQTKLLTGIPKDKIVPRTHPLVIFVLHILEKSSYTPHWDRAHIFLQGGGYSLKTVFSSHPVCRRTSWKADVLFSYRDITYLLSQTEFSLPSNTKATQDQNIRQLQKLLLPLIVQDIIQSSPHLRGVLSGPSRDPQPGPWPFTSAGPHRWHCVKVHCQSNSWWEAAVSYPWRNSTFNM